MSANWQNDIPHIVILDWGNLSALPNNHLVSASAVIFFIVTVELEVSGKPDTILSIVSVS